MCKEKRSRGLVEVRRRRKRVIKEKKRSRIRGFKLFRFRVKGI